MLRRVLRSRMQVTAEAVLGCLVGGAIGDALGGIGERGRACLSDDTQLTLATCEALLGIGAPDPARVADRFLAWYRGRRLVGLGASTLKALRDLDAGAHWAMAGARGERAAGNGPAMRAAPLAFVLAPGDPLARQAIRDVSRITHHHDEAYVGALAVVAAVRAAAGAAACGARPEPGEWMAAAAAPLPDSVTRDRLRTLVAAPRSLAAIASDFGSSGWTADTIPLAIAGAEAMARHDFGASLDELVAVSDDADTIASIAGQVAGASLGLDGLPAGLRGNVPELALVTSVGEELADRLADR